MAGQDVKGDMVAPSPANKQPVSTASCRAAQAPSHHLCMRGTAQLHLILGDAIQLQQGSVLLRCHPGMCSPGEGSGAGSRTSHCSAWQRLPAGACGRLRPPAELGHPGRHQPVDDLLRGHHHVQKPAPPGLWQAAGTRRISRHVPLSCRVSGVDAATLLAWSIALACNGTASTCSWSCRHLRLSSRLVPSQSKLFPQYFMLQTAGSAIALATLYYSGTGVLRPQLYALGGNITAFDMLA